MTAKTLYTRQMTVCGHGSLACGCKDATTTEEDHYAGTEEAEASIERIMRDFYESIDPLNFDKRKEAKELRDDLTIVLLLLFSLGYEDGTTQLREIGVTGMIPPYADSGAAAREFLGEYVPKLTQTVTQTVVDTITAALTQAHASGLSPDETNALLREKVSGLAEFGPARVASSETVRAFNSGAIAAADAATEASVPPATPENPNPEPSFSLKREWHTAEDEKVCPFCREMDGRIVDEDEPFHKAGDTMEVTAEPGWALRLVLDYGDVWSAPLHPGCRCWIRFVLAGSET